jgi:hypothetical protein
MESPIDPIDPEADPEALQEQTHSDPIEIELHREEQEHLPLAIVTTLLPETVLPQDADLHSDATAHLQETIGEQEPHLEPEVHPAEDSLLEETPIGGSGLDHQETIGISLTNGVLDSRKCG